MTPCFTESGNPAFTEARFVIECKKLYAGMLSEECFIEKHIYNTVYAKTGDVHKLYIAEMIGVWEKENL